MSILITAGTTAAAFALEKALTSGIPVIFGDDDQHPVPSILKTRFITIPSPEKETFIHELLTLSLDMEITEIYPLREEEQALLTTAEQLFAEFGVLIRRPKG